MTDKDYELYTELRNKADDLREELNEAAIEGEDAATLLRIARELTETLDKMVSLQ